MACVPSPIPSSLIIVIAILLSFPLNLLSYTAVAVKPSTSRDALLCLKSHISDPTGALATWNVTSLNFCSWHGVRCTNHPQRHVVALDLEAQGLTGEIPACIANLTSLERIHLPNNQLSGHIPPEVGQLTSLEYLNLSFNALGGEIPALLSACSGLQVIALKNNSIGGEIPSSLATLRNLSSLDFTTNNLSGEIPRLLGSSQPLEYVRLTNNFLRGEIPPHLANSSSLRYLAVANNSMEGGIPAALFNSSTITVIDLRRNNLSGPIPPFTKIPLPLKYLGLTGNNLAGTIPASVGNLSSLTGLLLAQNQLQGGIPDLSKLADLKYLDLAFNNLSGIVQHYVYNFSSLIYLGLASNSLEGTLPSDMGNNLPNMIVLMMSINQFEGEIPASLANASNLEYVYLANNSLSGVVPSFGSLPNLQSLMLYSNRLEAGDWAFLTSLRNCTQLLKLNLGTNNLRGNLPISAAYLPRSIEELILKSNNISGTIPAEIGNLTNLSLLYLDKNLLTGRIPSTVSHLRNLFALSLSHNQLSGNIPPSIGKLDQLSELYLDENDLSGSIPADLAGCKSLVALNLSCNALSGSVPEDLIGRLDQLSWFLDLSHNQLRDSIPPKIGSLINLGSLNISHNKFSGKIPPTLGACVHLESLRIEGNLLQGTIPNSLMNLRGMNQVDLSQNNLSGAIPEFFASFTSLQYLNLSFNNFEGPIPVGGVFANTSMIFVQGNPRLCANFPLQELPRCSAFKSKRKHKYIVPMLASLSAIIVLALFIGLLFLLVKISKKSKQDRKSTNSIHQSYMELKKLTYKDLSKATNGFSLSNVVGSGRFGTVYKGRLNGEDGTVAIKVFRLDEFGASDTFIAECKALRNTRHRNLVKVITACSTYDPMGNEFKALVFDYMTNGSLENRLHSKFQHCGELSLQARICIAVDIASALVYLHNQCIPEVVHCDLKPSNILFDNENVGCVCDFGLAKFILGYSSGGHSSSASMAGPRGSVGYIPPEYGMGSKVSTEGDVYSYGIILLEMLTMKRPTDEVFNDGFTIRKYVEASLSEIEKILDPNLIPHMRVDLTDHTPQVQEYGIISSMESYILRLLQLGLVCSEESPKDRPKMETVYSEVITIKDAVLSVKCC